MTTRARRLSVGPPTRRRRGPSPDHRRTADRFFPRDVLGPASRSRLRLRRHGSRIVRSRLPGREPLRRLAGTPIASDRGRHPVAAPRGRILRARLSRTPPLSRPLARLAPAANRADRGRSDSLGLLIPPSDGEEAERRNQRRNAESSLGARACRTRRRDGALDRSGLRQ